MKIKVAFALCCAGLVAGCGTAATNADVPGGVYAGVAARPTISDDTGVAVVDTGPAIGAGGTEVSGTSCKNKLWQPAPSRDNALALMKRQAKERGFNTVYAVEVKNDPSALLKNCWSAIVATGVAFKK